MATDLQSRYIYSNPEFSCPSSEFQAELRKYSRDRMLRRYVPLPGNVLPFWPDLVQSTHNSKERLYEPPKTFVQASICGNIVVPLPFFLKTQCIDQRASLHTLGAFVPFRQSNLHRKFQYHQIIISPSPLYNSYTVLYFIQFYAFAIHVQFRSRTPFRDAQVKGKTDRIVGVDLEANRFFERIYGFFLDQNLLSVDLCFDL